MMIKRNLLKRFLLCALFTICCPADFEASNNALVPNDVKPRTIAYNMTNAMISEMSKMKSVQDSLNHRNDSIMTELKKDSIKKELVAEVNKYMKSVSKKVDNNLAETLVNKALESNLDLCFMIGHSQIETCLGTAGAGRPTSRHSLFGVMGHKYHSYDEAINAYIRLLKKSYLVKGKTEFDLMKRFVTKSGKHYCASGGRYESKLARQYNKIKSTTSIQDLQNQYKNI